VARSGHPDHAFFRAHTCMQAEIGHLNERDGAPGAAEAIESVARDLKRHEGRSSRARISRRRKAEAVEADPVPVTTDGDPSSRCALEQGGPQLIPAPFAPCEELRLERVGHWSEKYLESVHVHKAEPEGAGTASLHYRTSR